MNISSVTSNNIMFNQKRRRRAAQLRAVQDAVDLENKEEIEALRQTRSRVLAARQEASWRVAFPFTPDGLPPPSPILWQDRAMEIDSDRGVTDIRACPISLPVNMERTKKQKDGSEKSTTVLSIPSNPQVGDVFSNAVVHIEKMPNDARPGGQLTPADAPRGGAGEMMIAKAAATVADNIDGKGVVLSTPVCSSHSNSTKAFVSRPSSPTFVGKTISMGSAAAAVAASSSQVVAAASSASNGESSRSSIKSSSRQGYPCLEQSAGFDPAALLGYRSSRVSALRRSRVKAQAAPPASSERAATTTGNPVTRNKGRVEPRISRGRVKSGSMISRKREKETLEIRKKGHRAALASPAARIGAGESARPMATERFSALNLCAVHLGSVTNNTVAAWVREVGRGGGTVTTAYSQGQTTHIVVDASLSWEALDRYVGWRPRDGEAPCVDVKGRNHAPKTPDDVPLVRSAWVVECLTRSTVVPAASYLFRIRPRPVSQEFPIPTPPHIPPSHTESSKVTTAPQSPGSATVRANNGPSDANRSASDERVQREALSGIVGEPGSGGGVAEEAGCMQDNKYPLLGTRGVKGGLGNRNPDIAEVEGVKSSNFFCQRGSSQNQQCCNDRAASMLESLGDIYSKINDHWRGRGFKKAAAVLRGLRMEITQVQQLKNLKKEDPGRVKGIGDSVMSLLEEFYRVGEATRLERLSSDPLIQSLTAFQDIWGVGPSTAERLIVVGGLRTIEDVRERGTSMLNKQQLIGLARYEDLRERMPRAEAAEIAAYVKAAAESLCHGVTVQACGSYRRGKQTCGDVDVLIRPPDGEEDCPIMVDLLVKLRSTGFITDDLSLPKPHEPGHSQTYMGVCRLPEEGRKHRRLDVKLYPTSLYGFAVLYFTGSQEFNMSMRCFARLKGFSLSDKGLCPVNRVDGEKVHKFLSYRCPREEDVFAALGLEWRDPEERGDRDVKILEASGGKLV